MGMGLCPPGALLLQPEWDSSVPLGSWIIHHHQGSSSTAPQSSFPGEKGECQGCLQEVLMSRNPGQRDSTGNLCPGSCTCMVNPENPTYPTEQKWPLHAKASVQHAPGCRNECCPPVPGLSFCVLYGSTYAEVVGGFITVHCSHISCSAQG